MADSSSSGNRKSSYTSVSTGPAASRLDPAAVANTAFITARKREWIRVMLENNVDRSKAEALAREHSRVDELAESVENGTLSDGALASLLHHRDAGVVCFVCHVRDRVDMTSVCDASPVRGADVFMLTFSNVPC